MHERLSVHEGCVILFWLQVNRRVALNTVDKNDNSLDDSPAKQFPRNSLARRYYPLFLTYFLRAIVYRRELRSVVRFRRMRIRKRR